MKYIHSRDDLRRWVDDGMTEIRINVYSLDYDDLRNEIVSDILDYLRDHHDFCFGDPMPEQFDDDNDLFWSFFEPYEKEEV